MTFSVFAPLCVQACVRLLKMFRSNCIFTDVRGQSPLSSPAEVKLIFSFVFDVKVPAPPLLLLPRPQHARRMAIFHLPSCCLPLLPVTVLLFLLPSFCLACRLLLPGCTLSPSLCPSPLFNQTVSQRQYFQLWMCICPSPGLL